VRKYLWDDQIIVRETAVAVVESSIESFEEFGFGFWRVSLRSDPSLIGFGGLRHFDYPKTCKKEVEILYGISPLHWGKGLATEIAGGVLRYGFDVNKLGCIYAGADLPNEASFRVIEKIGMIFDAQVTVKGVENLYYKISVDLDVG
jgi:RimJ/RimL family protein N-acetyltransferase